MALTPSRPHVHNKLRLQSSEELPAYSSPSLHRSIIAPLQAISIMVLPAILAAAALWKITFFTFLFNSPQALATDKPSNSKCYYPNGFLTKAGRSCTDDGSPSNCCSAGFECMNTGICKLNGVEYYERQSCTDSNWLDPSCSQMCIEGETLLHPSSARVSTF